MDLAESGKENPFSTDATQMVFASGGNYDFYMSLQPEVSDLPSILIGETNDVDRKTYISKDINSVESVNFAFKTENDKYYYRYSIASSVSYPKNDEWKEFIPNSEGNINIVIYSKPRILKEDSSGANISVYNSTDLKVRFDVIDDDKTSPRAYFKDARTISVIRK
jgi:type IV pilus assembly protein PilO